METTLDPQVNYNAKDDKENPGVKDALKLIGDQYSEKTTRDSKNREVQTYINEGFVAKDPNGTYKISSKKLEQVYWKTMSRIKLLDFVIHGTGQPEWKEKLVTDAVSTIMRKGGYREAFVDKGGAFQKCLAYGDAFVLFHTKDKGFPFGFQVLENDSVYIDNRATTMRGGPKPCRKMAVITSMHWAEFVQQYPEYKDKVKPGRISRSTTSSYLRSLDQSDRQIYSSAEKDIVEICHYFDVTNNAYLMFAGEGCTIMEEKVGKDYPYTFFNAETGDEESYIPVMHFKAIESFEGFYNHGVFEYIYDVCKQYDRLFNGMMSHAEDNADPFVVFNVPKGQTASVLNRLRQAKMMQAKGKKPVVPIEYDAMGAGKVTAEALTTQNASGEVMTAMDLLDREIKRAGFHLDELESSGVTATQILSDEENANAWVKQFMEKNATEVEFLVRVILDQIPKVIKKSDKTPLQMTSMISIPAEDATRYMRDTLGREVVVEEDIEMRADRVTLGDVANELKKNEYFVKVNTRSGVDASRLKIAQLTQILQMAGSADPQLSQQLIKQIAGLRDIDFDVQPTPQAVPGQVPSEMPAQPELVSATDRLTINPRQGAQTPVI